MRLSVVNFLGRFGPASAPALGEIARIEPCRHVRLAALQWLSFTPGYGAALYSDLVTPMEEERLAVMPPPAGMGKPLVVDAPGGVMTASFFNGAIDFRSCASSERAGRVAHPIYALPLPPPEESLSLAEPVPVPALPQPKAAAPASKPADPAPPRVSTPEEKRREAEIDSLLSRDPLDPSLGAPEALPPGGAGRFQEAAPAAEARLGAPEPRRGPASRALGAPLSPETLPPGAAGPYREDVPRPKAAYAEDAGTGKLENDPVPSLIEQLALKDPRRRARAADELGKRGAAALPAVPALRRALADRDRRVRASSALALGSVGGSVSGVAADLKRALRDKDEDVRFSAATALKRLKAP